MLDYLIQNASLPDDRANMSIGIKDDKIVELSQAQNLPAHQTYNAAGNLVTPPFVDSHFHIDSTLSLGQPRLNQSGTLLEGIQIWNELKPDLNAEHIKKRALDICKWAVAQGTLAIRSHVDICDDSLLATEVLLEVRKEMAPWIDLQLVAFPQDGYLRYKHSVANLNRALDMGVDVIGGIPHFERTMSDGAASVKALCELAAERGLMVDMHCDESDDPLSRHVETLAYETQRLGLQGRVTGSHLTSMHSMDNYYVSKLMSLMAEAKLNVVANPLINITLQGRHDNYPKRRGMTRVKELTQRGINVAYGHDCIMDPWYSLGSYDMLDVAHMGLHIGQMTGVAEMQASFQSVTANGAKTMNLEGYGLEIGCHADLVVLQAKDAVEALRLRSNRLLVMRRGKVVAKSALKVSDVMLGEQSETIDFRL
ncbi:amidohydrolase family protein [Leucothrix pacifica]|uniref:Cytosine deaminase n=1 Tax=Leucothrix pacifica TaxID=1247513 RepID=A0A317CQI7_9GAMM|nr:amidohydrolase family protein [Leucothrix pacifica]PWR00372.1 cytosine deaminase [Leucothrix pacifica]